MSFTQPSPSDDPSSRRTQRAKELLARSRPINVSDQPDSQSEAEKRELEHAQKRLQVAEAIQEMGERKNYANKSFHLVCVWLSGIGVILILQGFKVLGFSLDSSVMLALIGGTTTGVIGIFGIVARYLFYRPASSNTRSPQAEAE